MKIGAWRCGSEDPEHRVSRCRECKRRKDKILRETRGPRRTFTCDSCRTRQEIRAPLKVYLDQEGEGPASITLSKQSLAQLRWHAAEFDALAEAAGYLFTAKEFIDYLEPIIVGSPRYIAAHEASMVHVVPTSSRETGFTMPDTATVPR